MAARDRIDAGRAGRAGLPERGYTGTGKALHWLVAILVLVTLPVGLIMTSLGSGPAQNALFGMHKNIGVILLALMAVRIVWRLTHKAPSLEGRLPTWQRLTARTTHVLLYLILVVMVLSGYTLTTAGGYPIPLLDALHVPPLFAKNEALAKAATAVHVRAWIALAAVALLHIAAALRHLARGDGIVRRIAWGRR